MVTDLDDTDWHVDIKTQMHLMSKALGQWRTNIGDVTIDYPYGTQWDIFTIGHCMEVLGKMAEC